MSKKLFRSMSTQMQPSDKVVEELRDKLAAERTPSHKVMTKRRRWILRPALACMLCAAIVFSVIYFMPTSISFAVYAQGIDTPISEHSVEIATGIISDSGEMRRHLVQFYVKGTGITSIRFSCKNQSMEFNDWQEKSPSLGKQKQLTVRYDDRTPADYNSLRVDWTPWDIQSVLVQSPEITIEDLPSELREDVIVMEVTFSNGQSTTKAINIKLNDGNITATLSDFTLTGGDDFVLNAKSYTPTTPELAMDNEPETTAESASETKETAHTDTDIATARDVAFKYYTEFFKVPMNIRSLELDTGNSLLSEPDAAKYAPENAIAFLAYSDNSEMPRNICLVRASVDADWEVIGEGF